MKDRASLLLPTGIVIELEKHDVTLGGLIDLAQKTLNDPEITPSGFGALKHFFFVNVTTGSLLDSNLDVRLPFSKLCVNDGDMIELRVCKPEPEDDGSVLNPMRGVKTYVNYTPRRDEC